MTSETFNPDEYTVNHYKQQVVERKKFLETVPAANNFGILYNVLVPEVFCKNLVRIGTVTDGGKWVCNPTSLMSRNQCTVYSLGTAENPSFEEDFQAFIGQKCVVRSIDKDYQSVNTIKRINASNGVFMKALIAGTTNLETDQYKFADILYKFGDDRVDILKIDIEGAEHAIQDELVSIPICQILIEIHSPNNARKTLQLLQKFSKSGFYLYSYEVNGFYPELSEYSMIHESCLEEYGVTTIYGRYLS